MSIRQIVSKVEGWRGGNWRPPLGVRVTFFFETSRVNVPVRGWCGVRRPPKVQPSNRLECKPGTFLFAVWDLYNRANLDTISRGLILTGWLFTNDFLLCVTRHLVQLPIFPRWTFLYYSTVLFSEGRSAAPYIFWYRCSINPHPVTICNNSCTNMDGPKPGLQFP